MKFDALNSICQRRRSLAGRWWPALLALMLASPALEAEPVTIAVDGREPGARISNDALGLSYETSILLPDDQGRRYFRPWNKRLINLFRTLGVRNLRIGGNSVDDPKISIPSEADVRSLFEFALEAGVKVTYSVRLQDGDPASAAKIAKFIHDNFSSTLESFSIGNEPGYYKDYEVYSKKWTEIRDAILEVFPRASFSGPDQNPEPELIKKMVKDFGSKDGRLTMITQHSYPFGCSYENPGDGMKDVTLLRPVDAAKGREQMLQPAAYETYSKILNGMVEAVEGTPVTFRMTETNSFWFSGLEGASDRHASALWGLDYLHWWSSHGADGLNFHTGDRTGGSVNLPCRYAAFVSADEGYEVRPLGYGMKLFELGGHGQSLPVEVPVDSGLASYATHYDNAVFVTLIHKRHDAGEAEVKIDISTIEKLGQAKLIRLLAKGNDLAAESAAMSLGGAPIQNNGNWDGNWEDLESSETDDSGKTSITVSMPAASAAVLRIELLQAPPVTEPTDSTDSKEP